MRFSIVLLSFSLLYISCNPKYYPLEGQYPKWPIVGYSEKPYNQVWDGIVGYLKQNDMNIKKDSTLGLIISKKSKLTSTYERDNGQLYYPDSYVVAEQEISPTNYKAKRPQMVMMGEWYILVEPANGRTSVKVSLLNIEAFGYQIMDQGRVRDVLVDPHARTTGVFENKLFAAIQ